MPVDRRELFKIIGAGFVSSTASGQHEHRTPTSHVGDYEPRVFSKEQFAMLGRMLDILLPADSVAPSARQAGVGMYIDTTLKHGDDGMRATWTSGLAALDRLARDSGAKGFADLDDAGATAILSRLAAGETRPASEAEKFFVDFKQSAINAYYLSESGRKSLGYKGDTAIREFPGCTHAEHKPDKA